MKRIKSPLNYIGGKTKLLDQILPLFPPNIKMFVDLFAGGCNVGLNVRSEQVIFNDNLNYLIDLYRYFQTNEIGEILDSINERIQQYNLSKFNIDGYNQLRSYYNLERRPIDLFVLICYSFNHQIRFNNNHEFNTPLGKNRSSYNQQIENNLIAFKRRLNEIQATFHCNDFSAFDYSSLGKEDFVYCDPPYLITTGSYNDGKRGFKGWTSTEECALYEMLNKLDEQGIKFALSNVIEHKGLTNKFLADWINKHNDKLKVNKLNFNYSNSNYQTSKSRSIEVLVTNYEPQVLTLF